MSITTDTAPNTRGPAHAASVPSPADEAAAAATAKRNSRKAITGVLVLPLFFMIALPILFMGLLHAPSPNHMKVAVIGDAQTASSLVSQLKDSAGDSFDVSRVSTVASAKHKIRDLDIRGAYDPTTGKIYTTQTEGTAIPTVVQKLFTPVATASHVTPTDVTLKALPKEDPLGTSALYIGLGAIVGGMVSGIILGLTPTTTKVRVAAAIVMPVVVSAIEVLYGWSLFDIFPGSAWVPGFLLFALSFVSLVLTTGGMLLIGPGMLLVSMLVLTFLGITTSGVPMAMDMAPSFYGALHNILPTARGLSALRRVIYVHGYNYGLDILVIIIWSVVGIAMGVAGTLRKRRQAIEAAEPSSFVEAEDALVSDGVRLHG